MTLGKDTAKVVGALLTISGLVLARRATAQHSDEPRPEVAVVQRAG